jgi:hypothetical protein
MVSTDHFRQELLAQLDRAATGGTIDVLITSGELCRAVPKGSAWSNACCDAMQAEFRQGDTMVLGRTNRAGMTVRYLLPRTSTFKSVCRSFQIRPPPDSIRTRRVKYG